MRLLVIGLAVLALLPATILSAPDKTALVTIESRDPFIAERLLATDVMIVRDMGRYLLALADERGMATLDALGLRWEILDDDTEGKTYYTVDFRDEKRLRAAASRIRILKQDGLAGVIEASPREALTIAGDGCEIARVFLRPIRLSPVVKPMPRRAPAQPDPLIEEMVDSVSTDRINSHVQRLQDFVTRYSSHDSCLAASQWIGDRFESYGIDSVYFHDFSALYYDNVVAVLPGIVHPDKIVIIGGHYDSITSNPDDCPGADDNASGTACVLECARILSDYEFDYTLTFIAFCGEELGLLGSEAYTSEAAARGDDIIGMVNVDMIGYVEATDELDLDIIDNPSSLWMRQRIMDVGALYVPELSVVKGTLIGGNSDHRSFWDNGYDAIMFFEDSEQWSPFIHTANDVVGLSYNSPLLAERSVKLAVAFLADLARPFVLGIDHTPLDHTEDESNPYRVVAKILAAGTPNPDSLLVRYSTTGGGWNTLTLNPTGAPDEYEAFIPAQPGGTVVDYYLIAEDMTANRVTDPEDAPSEVHAFAVGTPTIVFEDDFEADRGWTVGDIDDDATAGIWERDEPYGTYVGDEQVQPEEDHTEAPGVMCFITGNAPNPSQSNDDVDNGKTTLFSPIFDLSSYANAWLSYYRWYTNDTGTLGWDVWVVDVSSDSGATWVRLETDSISDRSWKPVEHNLLHFVPMTSGIQLRFVASDEDPGSVVEAGVDDFLILTYQGSGSAVLPGRPAKPTTAQLEQNFPNPFNPETVIRFTIPEPGGKATLRVYDVTGRAVATLIRGERVSGTRAVRWNGTNDAGYDVPTGVYFYRLEIGEQRISRKLVLLR
ncbi:MAG: M28 family peptidase [Candidatus Latescibacterota bacterium]|nr:MAG: M28 family peptidase [Candidatus Latescibacterota bacterium]